MTRDYNAVLTVNGGSRHDRRGGRPNILDLSSVYSEIFHASPALLEQVLAIIALRAAY
jgi:hypothetical protein